MFCCLNIEFSCRCFLLGFFFLKKKTFGYFYFPLEIFNFTIWKSGGYFHLLLCFCLFWDISHSPGRSQTPYDFESCGPGWLQTPQKLELGSSCFHCPWALIKSEAPTWASGYVNSGIGPRITQKLGKHSTEGPPSPKLHSFSEETLPALV